MNCSTAETSVGVFVTTLSPKAGNAYHQNSSAELSDEAHDAIPGKLQEIRKSARQSGESLNQKRLTFANGVEQSSIFANARYLS